MALSSGKNTTAETVVPSGTQRKPGPIGDKERPTASSQKRVIDISALDEDELLGMLRGYINSMCAFVKSNRNVHKELKETLANSSVVLTQYTKVKNRTSSTGTRINVCKSQHTQTGVATKDATTNTDAPACQPPPPKPQLAGEKRKQQQPQQNQPGQQLQPEQRLGLQATGRKEKKNRPNKEQHQQQQQHRVEPEQPTQEADHNQQQQLTWSQVARRSKKSKKEDPPPLKKDATHGCGETSPTTAQGPKNGGGHHRSPCRQRFTSCCDEESVQLNQPRIARCQRIDNEKDESWWYTTGG